MGSQSPEKTTDGKTKKTTAAKTQQARKTAASKSSEKTVAPKAKRTVAASKKILFAAPEVSPFVSTGGLGQVVGALPPALVNVDKKLDIRVVAPLYRQVREHIGSGMTFLGNIHVPLSWRSQYCGVFMVERKGVIYYFLDNEYYFNRERCYGYFDDGERFAFFSKAVLASLELIGFTPDIIHAHDWQTALVPIYLKTTYAEKYPNMRSVFTIHNIEYQGKFSMSILGDVLGLGEAEAGIVEYEGSANLLKGAVVCCDRLTTVSPSYAEEIKYGGGFGLEPIILMNEGKFSGIINGIDTGIYDPETDPSLIKTYSCETVEDKAQNKRFLQELFGLPIAPRTPLLCMVSRLVQHKGIDLIIEVMEELLSDGVQFLILGTGDHRYELFFADLAMRHPNQVAVNIAFNPEIGNKIYAGADIMLMPSRSEPCGLSQMTACRYAAIPVARATGGIKDTIRDCRGGEGNGFVFQNYDAYDLLSTARQAIHMYTYCEDDWRNLMCEAMRSDFKWDSSARLYLDLYKGLL